MENLFENGLGFIWYEQDNPICEKYLTVNKQRITDSFIQKVMVDSNGSPKGILSKHIVDHFTLQIYLCKTITSLNKKQISRIRLASHNLAILKVDDIKIYVVKEYVNFVNPGLRMRSIL